MVQEGSVGLPPIPAPAGCLHMPDPIFLPPQGCLHVPDSMLLPHCCLHAADPILLSVLPPRTRSHLADDLLVFDRKSPSPAPTSMVAHTVGIDCGYLPCPKILTHLLVVCRPVAPPGSGDPHLSRFMFTLHKYKTFGSCIAMSAQW